MPLGAVRFDTDLPVGDSGVEAGDDSAVRPADLVLQHRGRNVGCVDGSTDEPFEPRRWDAAEAPRVGEDALEGGGARRGRVVAPDRACLGSTVRLRRLAAALSRQRSTTS